MKVGRLSIQVSYKMTHNLRFSAQKKVPKGPSQKYQPQFSKMYLFFQLFFVKIIRINEVFSMCRKNYKTFTEKNFQYTLYLIEKNKTKKLQTLVQPCTEYSGSFPLSRNVLPSYSRVHVKKNSLLRPGGGRPLITFLVHHFLLL